MHTTQHIKYLGTSTKATEANKATQPPTLRRGPVPLDRALLHHVRGGASAPAFTDTVVQAPKGKW